MTRRGFVGNSAAWAALAAFGRAFAAGTEDAQAGGALPPWARGHFQVHFIYTGAGESLFLVFPDGTTMLLDCGDFDSLSRGRLAVPVLPDSSRKAGEWIARYVKRVNPNGDRVDYMLTSHYHDDHTGTKKNGWWPSGWMLAADQLHFRKALDRAYPAFDDPAPFTQDQNRVVDCLREVYERLRKRDGLVVEKFRLGAEDQIVPLRDPAAAKGFVVRNICANGRIAMPDGTVVSPLVVDGQHAWYYDENEMSCGSVFTYGGFRFFTAGDFSGRATLADGTDVYPETLLGKAAGRVNVAKIDHHGFHSMREELLRGLQARVYVASIWDQYHMTVDTLTRLSDRSIYPGERLIAPGYLPPWRLTMKGAKPWAGDIPTPSLTGAHIVLDVAPGGETYSISFVDARDEKMNVLSVLHFKS